MVGSGSACVSATLTNDDLSQLVDTSDEWIATRTGIRQRHIAGPADSLGSLAADAARQALAMAEMDAFDLQLILLATSTPR